MVKILKYVIDTANTPVLFSSELLHNTVRDEALSAGYLLIRYNYTISSWSVVSCFGESTTLNIKSNPVLDKLLINNFLKEKAQSSSLLSFDFL